MPYKCIVPNCKGNYKNGLRVRVFSLPNNKKLSDVWICIIKRDNFSSTELRRVSIFSVLKMVNVIETLMIKLISCLCNSQKKLRQKYSEKVKTFLASVVFISENLIFKKKNC